MIRWILSLFYHQKKVPLHCIDHLCISRTDAIGDVVLTLPLAGMIKKTHPGILISFLCSEYTREVVRCCEHVDKIVPLPQMRSYYENHPPDMVLHIFPSPSISRFFSALKVPYRIGTWGRWHHWLYCNYIVPMSRKNSSLHEAALNTRLLGATDAFIPDFKDFHSYYGFRFPSDFGVPEELCSFKEKKYIILHPRSRGSAREWKEENFIALAEVLYQKGFAVLVCGTEKEKQGLKQLPYLPYVHNLMGRLQLHEYIFLISRAYGLVAASTGPLHIAAMCGIKAAGLYPSRRPMHAGRWGPLGKNAASFRYGTSDDCKKCNTYEMCECMNRIPVEKILLFLTA